jgi:hypothetical protein
MFSLSVSVNQAHTLFSGAIELLLFGTGQKTGIKLIDMTMETVIL